MNYKKGINLALITALFSGMAVFLNSLTVKAVGDALVFTTIKNLGVALILAGILLRSRIDWAEVRNQWRRLLLIGVIGGSLPFYLFFQGLSLTNPATGALIHKTLIFWVALWAVPFLKEKISLKQWLALGLIFGSNFIIGGLPQIKWGTGEWMILAATVFWSIENIIAKITLKRLEAEVVVGARMILGSLILLVAVGVSGKMGLVSQLNGNQWGLTILSMGLLTGYVVSWYRAMKVAPVTLVATVLTLATVVTNVLSSVFITHNLTIGLLFQVILLGLGMVIFSREVKKNAGSLAVRQVCV